jgi:hypothetical protein
VCQQRALRCADGDEREVVLLYSRMCTGAPILVLGLVDSRAAFTDVLTDDVEAAAERLDVRSGRRARPRARRWEPRSKTDASGRPLERRMA